jgi:hypothetical protein
MGIYPKGSTPSLQKKKMAKMMKNGVSVEKNRYLRIAFPCHHKTSL